MSTSRVRYLCLLAAVTVACSGLTIDSKFITYVDPKPGYNPANKSAKLIGTTAISACLASISWIPEEYGLPVYDPEPPRSLSPDACAAGSVPDSSYRFSNIFMIQANILEYDDRKEYKGSLLDFSHIGSTVYIKAKRYIKPDASPLEVIRDPNHGKGVRFTSFVCARTRLPNPEAMPSNLRGIRVKPYPKHIEPILFPVIWTKLRFTIFEDKAIYNETCIDWSLFPKHYCYNEVGEMVKTNSPDLDAWKASPENPCK